MRPPLHHRWLQRALGCPGAMAGSAAIQDLAHCSVGAGPVRHHLSSGFSANSLTLFASVVHALLQWCTWCGT